MMNEDRTELDVPINRLPLRMRADLDWQAGDTSEVARVVVKDPLALKYFLLSHEEFFVLQQLDGCATLANVRNDVERRFPDWPVTTSQLHSLIGRFYRDGLLVSDAPGQGESLFRRNEQKRRTAWIGKLTNLLCMRFRGVNPDRFLSWLNQRMGWLFSPAVALASFVVMVFALGSVIIRAEAFREGLPGANEFFSTSNWLPLLVTLAITKVLHELGHGLACKRFGGTCHEMGLMLLVFTPCMYCNVTDSWMIPNRWRRLIVAAAGVYVELILLSVSILLWWNTAPGWLHSICVNVMFVCSISSLVFNVNPLVRYDGYYMLSDALNLPNLRQQSQAWWHGRCLKWLSDGGSEGDLVVAGRQSLLLASYGLLSTVYRVFVISAIVAFLWHFLEPMGLESAGRLIGIALLGSLVALPLAHLVGFLQDPIRRAALKRSRLAIVGMTGIAMVCGGLWIPIPRYVPCTFRVQLREAATVYVKTEGMLARVAVEDGQQVAAGQTLAVLENPDVDWSIQELIADRTRIERHLVDLEQRSLRGNSDAQAEIDNQRKMLETVRCKLAQKQRELQSLTLVAPADGAVIVSHESAESNDADTWLPLQAKHTGAYLSAGLMLCQIGNPSCLEAVLDIDRDDVEFVREGQRVELLPAQATIGRLSSVISDLSMRQAALERNGQLTDSRGGSRSSKTQEQVFRAACPVTMRAGTLPVGGIGHAKIYTGSQTMATYLFRCFTRTFDVTLERNHS